MDWQWIAGTLVGLAVQVATSQGGQSGAEFAKRLRQTLADSGVPLLRKAAQEIGDEAAAKLPPAPAHGEGITPPRP